MNRYAVTLALPIALILSGCPIPVTYIYYNPTLINNQVEDNEIYVVSSSGYQLHIKISSLDVLIRGPIEPPDMAPELGSNSVTIEFLYGNWNSFSFTSTKFKFHNPENNLSSGPVQAGVRRSNQSKHVPLAEPVSLPTKTESSSANNKRSNVVATQWLKPPSDFSPPYELISPSIIIDGREMVFPKIQFRKKTGIGLGSML